MTKNKDTATVRRHLFKPLLRDIVSPRHAMVKLADAGDLPPLKCRHPRRGTFLHRAESLRGIGRGSCRLFRLGYDDCCRHCPRRHCKQFQTCLSMECIAGLHANDEERRTEQSESPHMPLTGMDAAGRTLRIVPGSAAFPLYNLQIK